MTDTALIIAIVSVIYLTVIWLLCRFAPEGDPGDDSNTTGVS